MKITLLYGTKMENHNLQVVRAADYLRTNALILTDRTTEASLKSLIKAAHESDGDPEPHILLVTNDPTLTVTVLIHLAATFPELYSIRWSGNWGFDATQAFRVVPWPSEKTEQ